jgi:hypothetical protein
MTAQANNPSPGTQGYESKIASILERISTSEVDAEKVLTLFKLGAEAEKLEAEKNKATQDAAKVAIDSTLAAKQLRLSHLSMWTTQLVPLAALLTVAVTFYGSYEQNKQTRIAEEQKLSFDEKTRQRVEWETFKSSFDSNSSDELYKKPTFLSRLKIFIASGKYDTEISDLRVPLLGDFTNKSGFIQVWSNTFKQVEPSNFPQILDVARAQQRKYNRDALECGLIPIPPNTISIQKPWASLGPCIPAYPNDVVARAYNDKPDLSKRVSVLRDEMFGMNFILGFLSEKIATYVKANPTPKSTDSYDLSEIIFNVANFDGVDFSKTILSQSSFYQSSVKGANFTLPDDKMTYAFPGTAWWEAASINQTILRWLIANAYPGSDSQSMLLSPVPAEESYQMKVQNLCANKSGWCDKICIKFGQSTPQPPPSCLQTN